MFTPHSDDGSGISDVAVALGYTTHDVNLLHWTSIDTGELDVYLPDGVNVYAKVRATNNGKLHGARTSMEQYLL